VAVLPKLTGLRNKQDHHRPKHQIIKIMSIWTMQIPFSTDERLAVACRQVRRHVHSVLGSKFSISVRDFDFEIVVDDDTVVSIILNYCR
jgi:hypothetical protein